MTIPRSRLAPRVLVALALGGVGAACTYGWTVGPVAVGGDGDGGIADGAVDAGGGADAIASDAGDDASRIGDAGHDAADGAKPSPCESLAADLVSERGPAKACTIGGVGACGTSIVDECGCTSFLGTAGSGKDYAASVAAYEEAGCPHPSWCTSCLEGTSGTCLYVDASTECVP